MEPRFYLEPWYVAGGQGLACDSLTCFFSSCFRSGFQNRLVRALLLAKFSLFLAGKPSDEAHKTVFLLLDFCVAALLLAPFYFCAKPFAMWWPDGAAHVPLTHVCMHWWSKVCCGCTFHCFAAYVSWRSSKSWKKILYGITNELFDIPAHERHNRARWRTCWALSFVPQRLRCWLCSGPSAGALRFLLIFSLFSSFFPTICKIMSKTVSESSNAVITSL